MNTQTKCSVLVFGASGLLGTDLCKEARARGYEIESPGRDVVDVTNDLELNAYILNSNSEWVINCAAYTAVDQAETDEDTCSILNAAAAFNIARYVGWKGRKLVHVSTDFVFDGTKGQPYSEADEVNPLGAYGKSKLHGEQLVLDKNPDAIIVRTAWLFGAHGKCFPRTIINAARSGKQLRVVGDQIGSPSYSRDVGAGILNILEAEASGGIYHLANSGEASWYDLAVATLDAAGIESAVEKIRSSDWPTPAPRPGYSVLSTAKYQSLGYPALPSWKDAVNRFAKELSLES